MRARPLSCVAAAVLAASPLWAQAPDFAREVQPILAEHCYPCHGPDARQRKADLRLDTFAAATAIAKSGRAPIVAKDVAQSELLRRIDSPDHDELMPPPEAKKPLSAAQRAVLRRWIEQGAAYARHWAFEPPTKRAANATGDTSWCRDELDHYVLARLQRAGLTPQPDADRATLLRRAHLVLTGLPPTPAEIDAFATDDSRDAYERRVDELLQRPACAEHMATAWLDLARFADTYGYQSDFECRTWPWRDWLIDALQRDLPYDRFATELIAGDLVPDANRSTRTATAFFRLHRQTNEGGSIPEEWRHEYIADRVDTLGTAFLGLTVGCARCHDHKFDPITQRDYYALGSFFAIDESGLYPYTTGGTPQPAMRLSNAEQDAEIARRTTAVAAAEAKVSAAIAAPRQSERTPLAPALAHYAFDDVVGGKTPDAVRKDQPTDVPAAVTLVDGQVGKALQLDGDAGITLPGVPAFAREDAYSVAFWLWCPDRKERAVVLHTSSYTEDADTQGYQILIENGRLSWQIVHHWPGSACAIATTTDLPLKRWIHIAVTYDGSSRAAGMAIHLDGVRAETTVVRDHLQGPAHVRTLQLGARDRDRGFAAGKLDEVMVFARELLSSEIRTLANGAHEDSAAEAQALAIAQDPAVIAARAELTTARRQLHGYVESLPELMVLAENRTPQERFVLKRGAYDQPDRTQPVQPGAIAELRPFTPSGKRTRAELAAWLCASDHPLFARVAVNRLWAQCFGQGLVRTQENFGVLGEAPLLPELLDALAVDFTASGFRQKALLRRIVTSSAFRQRSTATAAVRERDPDNRLLARGPSFRLSAEVLRDQALQAAGLLHEQIGGPSVKPWQPPGLWSAAGVGWGGGDYQPDQGPNAHRRSLYSYRKRTAPPPNMMTLDGTSREVCTARRLPTNTPLQALVFLNDRVFLECAIALADLVLRDPNTSGDEAKLARAFAALTGRAPRPRETEPLQQLLAEQRAAFAADPLAASQLLAELQPDPERAAWTLLASTLLASDATLVMR